LGGNRTCAVVECLGVATYFFVRLARTVSTKEVSASEQHEGYPSIAMQRKGVGVIAIDELQHGYE